MPALHDFSSRQLRPQLSLSTFVYLRIFILILQMDHLAVGTSCLLEQGVCVGVFILLSLFSSSIFKLMYVPISPCTNTLSKQTLDSETWKLRCTQPLLRIALADFIQFWPFITQKIYFKYMLFQSLHLNFILLSVKKTLTKLNSMLIFSHVNNALI